MTDITREALTYDEDGVATYAVQIKDFHLKMKNWPSSTRGIRSESFKVQGVVLYLSIYPNGDDKECKGYVSIYLHNASSMPAYVDFKLQIGSKTMQRFGNVT